MEKVVNEKVSLLDIEKLNLALNYFKSNMPHEKSYEAVEQYVDNLRALKLCIDSLDKAQQLLVKISQNNSDNQTTADI